MKITDSEKAEVLVQALPYIQKYSGKTVVVKYGGNAMINEELKKSVMRDLVLLNQIGVKVVLVHGGGPEIDKVMAEMGLTSKFEKGLRVTDGKTMEVVQMVLCGKINKDLVNLIGNCGGKAVGLSGVDGNMIEAVPVSEKLGFVGDIVNVNPQTVKDALDMGYIPVISSVGGDKNNNVYNINADTVAARIAGALNAQSLISMTDIKGILADPEDESTLIPAVSVSETNQLIKEGVITGGMIPKVACCVEAIRRGVDKVFIIDGRVPHAIIIEILSDEGIGTMFY